MLDETLRLLRRLESADWTSHVGMPVEDGLQAGDWLDAVTIAMCAQTQCCIRDEADMLSAIVQEISTRDDANVIDALADAVVADVHLIVSNQLTGVLTQNGIPHVLIDVVSQVVTFAIAESEHSGVISRRFFRDYADWLISGHLPCGWTGDMWPNGRFIVF